MKLNSKKLSVLLLGLSVTATLLAESWTYHNNFTSATSIAFRNTNELWMSAKGGLLKYDRSSGQKQFFSPGTDDLPSFQIEQVAVHPQTNEVWIGTYDNGLAVLNSNSRWTRIPFPDNGAKLYEMKIAANGDVWAATTLGLYRYSGGRFETFLRPAPQRTSSVWGLDFLPNGTLLLATENPAIFDPASLQFQNITCSAIAYGNSCVSVKNDSVFYYANDRGSIVKFLHFSQQSVLNAPSEVISHAQLGEDDYFLLQNKSVVKLSSGVLTTYPEAQGIATAFAVSSSGMWIGTGYSNVEFDKQASLLQVAPDGQVWEIDLRQSGIKGDRVVDFSHSGAENFVYITFPKGIQKWNKISRQFEQAFSTTEFFTLFRTKAFEMNGTVYVGSTKGLNAFRSDGTMELLGENLSDYPELSCLTKDDQGNLWMGGEGFIARYDGTGFQLFTSSNHPGLNTSINDIHYDAVHQVIWASSTNGIFQISNGVVNFFDNYDPGAQMTYKSVFEIEEDSEHNIWFTSLSHFVKFDGVDFSLLPVIPRELNSGLQFDGTTMYSCYSKSGLLRYENEQWDSLTRSNSPMGTNNISALYIDEESNVWMGHENGLIIYNRDAQVSSISELGGGLTSEIFPNPSKGLFTIKTDLDMKEAELDVFSVSGQSVYHTVFNSSSRTIDLRDQNSGIYYYKLKSASGTATGRLILE